MTKIWSYHAFSENKYTCNHIFIYWRALKENSNSLRVFYHGCSHKISDAAQIAETFNSVFTNIVNKYIPKNYLDLYLTLMMILMMIVICGLA